MRVIGVVVSIVLAASGASAADMNGDWQFALTILDDVSYARATLKVEGDKVSGRLGENTVTGTTTGDQVTFTVTRPGGQPNGRFTGKLVGAELKGTASIPNLPGETTWSGRREAKRAGAPQVHKFEPTQFHRVFSDAMPPVLHIHPGDTVQTWTVDAAGVDNKGVRRSQGGNPETGPFYVEGAMPGDTLVVKLNRVRLNRDSAISSGQISSNALTPNYVQRTKYRDDFDSDWVLDRVIDHVTGD